MRIFANQLDVKQCQRFFHEILLDRVRADIAETRKLNVHLYAALRRALRKPAAFFKGILFPLCEVKRCGRHWSRVYVLTQRLSHRVAPVHSERLRSLAAS